MSRPSPTSELVRERRQEILRVAAAHGASNVRLFGSVARGDTSEAGDLDLLVTLAPERSLLDQVALWQDLEELLGCKVDLVLDSGLSPYLRDRILAEARPL